MKNNTVMEQYISKAALVREIEERIKKYASIDVGNSSELDALYGAKCHVLKSILTFLDTLEVKDPYELCVQYDSIKAGIQAHAETYSFNIESKLFNQLSKEQQGLWRKEIEQACISGGEVGVELAKDLRYKENLEVKEVNLEEEIASYIDDNTYNGYLRVDIYDAAEHFFELGLKAERK